MKLQDLIMKYLAAKNGPGSDGESGLNQAMKDSYLFLLVNSFSNLVREKELYGLLSEANKIDLFQSLLSKYKTSSEQLISDIILFIQNCQTPKSASNECDETSQSQKKEKQMVTTLLSIVSDYEGKLFTKDQTQKINQACNGNNNQGIFAPITEKPKDFIENIFKACEKGNLSSVRYLIEVQKIDIESRTKGFVGGGCTPFWIACKYGQLEVVQYLCERQNIDKEAVDNQGFSPFWRAA